MRLHPHAAIRVLRAEQKRLHDARGQLAAAMHDPRAAQLEIARLAQVIAQVCTELTELEEACATIEAGWEAEQGQLAFVYDEASRVEFATVT